MNNIRRSGRRYAYKMRYKYKQDPFAFIVLWVLFFSTIFLVFAFRGLIAVSFMKKMDIDTSRTTVIEEEIDKENNLESNN